MCEWHEIFAERNAINFRFYDALTRHKIVPIEHIFSANCLRLDEFTNNGPNQSSLLVGFVACETRIGFNNWQIRWLLRDSNIDDSQKFIIPFCSPIWILTWFRIVFSLSRRIQSRSCGRSLWMWLHWICKVQKIFFIKVLSD